VFGDYPGYVILIQARQKLDHEERGMNSHYENTQNSEGKKAQIRAIRSAHPGNLMARYFSEDYFNSLDESKHDRLWRIVRTGIENPDSQMGAYAQNSSDYEDFEPLFEPMIRDYHNIPREQEIGQKHDWSATASRCNLEDIDPALNGVSMRVRVGRNLAAFPLPGAMTKAHRLEFEALMIKAFTTLQGDPQFGGDYLSLTPGSSHAIDEDAYRRRVEAHQMFKDMGGDRYLVSAGISSDWPFGRGMYVSSSDDFIIWVGEEDHLRIMAMRQGGDLAAVFGRLHDGLEELAKLIPAFAHSPRYGYVTSCPTNLGTAMRASLHLPLPGLTEGGSNLEPAKKAALDFGLSVRGAGGEHSDAGQGGLVDISPSARLGVTETEIMQRLYTGTAALWSLEKAS
jgi:creatine kinase